MLFESRFAPFRLRPGALPAEAERLAGETLAGPLVAGLDEAVAGEMAGRAAAGLEAGRAGSAEEACRSADGDPAGRPGAMRACLSSGRHLRRLADAAARALAAGFPGVLLERPDSPLALGLLGAGYCADCQRAFARELVREYGEQLQPMDYARVAREALAQAPGALGFALLPFGRDYWRFRVDALVRAVAASARAARDAARAARRPFAIAAEFEALGPGQLAAARHLDAAVFPAAAAAAAPGTGLFRLLRAVMGRRPCAVAFPGGMPAAGAPALAALAAACGVEVCGEEPGGAPARELAAVRRFARAVRAEGPPAEPVAECAVLYSPEADLWTAGRHREAVELAGEVLGALHVQAPVVLRVADAPPEAALVLSGAEALSPLEAQAVRRRLEGGGAVLAFGEAGAVDEGGRPAPPFLPAGKPGGAKVGAGTLAALPSLLPPLRSGLAAALPDLEPVERALAAVLGRGHRTLSLSSRAPVRAFLWRTDGAAEAHLAALGGETAKGAMLFLGLQAAGGARRARFRSADGADERIGLNPSGYSVSTVLPSFRGYAVLTLAT